jgi:hypothetical protein
MAHERFGVASGATHVTFGPVDVAPGHDAWVVGDDHAVLIEVDFEADTIGRLGMPEAHRHE